MKILVTGATGFVGTALVRLLKRQGHALVLVANQNAAKTSQHHFHSLDISTRPDWRPLLIGCDVVVHLAARVHVMKESENADQEYLKLNVEATNHLAQQALESGVKRFIYLSSLKVNGECNVYERAFTEQDTQNPVGSYAQSKYQAEQILFDLARKSSLEVTVIRPPLVYGPNVRANFQSLLSVVYNQRPLPFAGIKNQRSYVYVENLVSLIARCLDHPKAANECFFVSDGHDLSTPQLIAACATALGVKPKLFYVPQSVLHWFSKFLRKEAFYQRLCGDLTVDISKSKRLLGWRPQFSVEAGMTETAKAFKRSFVLNQHS